jgi:hypothetical protein
LEDIGGAAGVSGPAVSRHFASTRLSRHAYCWVAWGI